MYSNSYYDRLYEAFDKYINAITDHTVPYSHVLELREVYESIVKEKPDLP